MVTQAALNAWEGKVVYKRTLTDFFIPASGLYAVRERERKKERERERESTMRSNTLVRTVHARPDTR